MQVEFCIRLQVGVGGKERNIFTAMLRHYAGLTIQAVVLFALLHPTVVASSKYCQSSEENYVVTCKAEWMLTHSIIWHTTAIFTRSVNIGRKHFSPGKNKIIITSKSELGDVVPDISDATWCDILTIPVAGYCHAAGKSCILAWRGIEFVPMIDWNWLQWASECRWCQRRGIESKTILRLLLHRAYSCASPTILWQFWSLSDDKP